MFVIVMQEKNFRKYLVAINHENVIWSPNLDEARRFIHISNTSSFLIQLARKFVNDNFTISTLEQEKI